MTIVSLEEPGHVDEPRDVQNYSDMFTQVAADGRAVIVRRNGEDLAAVISLEQLELVREVLGRRETQKLATEIDWQRARATLRPAEKWFEGDEPKPF